MINKSNMTIRLVGMTLCLFSAILMILVVRVNDDSSVSKLSSSAFAGVVGAAGILALTAKE